MELSLSWKAERGAGIEKIEWGALEECRIGDSRLSDRGELVVERRSAVVGAEDEEAVDALEVAFDVFEVDDCFDPLDRRGVGFGGEAGSFFAVKKGDPCVPIVELRGQVRGGSAGFSAANSPIIDHNDCLSGPGEEVRRREAGDPRAYDTHVCPHIFP